MVRPFSMPWLACSLGQTLQAFGGFGLRRRGGIHRWRHKLRVTEAAELESTSQMGKFNSGRPSSAVPLPIKVRIIVQSDDSKAWSAVESRA